MNCKADVYYFIVQRSDFIVQEEFVRQTRHFREAGARVFAFFRAGRLELGQGIKGRKLFS
jgi:hypothetical protein